MFQKLKITTRLIKKGLLSILNSKINGEICMYNEILKELGYKESISIKDIGEPTAPTVFKKKGNNVFSEY